MHLVNDNRNRKKEKGGGIFLINLIDHSYFHSFCEILGYIINPNIAIAVRINPTLKIVMKIGTSPKNPIIPEIKDNIITVSDVKVLIFRPENNTADPPQQPQSPQQQPVLKACMTILNLQSIEKSIDKLTMSIYI